MSTVCLQPTSCQQRFRHIHVDVDIGDAPVLGSPLDRGDVLIGVGPPQIREVVYKLLRNRRVYKDGRGVDVRNSLCS